LKERRYVMAIRIVRLGTERAKGEGTRIGTVRRPPRGVPKSKYASENWYDVWLPNVAPSPELMKRGKAAQSEKDWAVFLKKYRTEMADPEKSRILPCCLTVLASLWAATARTKSAVTGPYCGSSWQREGPRLYEQEGKRGSA